jgi:hypothetical protein
MIINRINNNNRKANIIDWAKQDVSLSFLQHKQAKFKQWGFVLHHELTSAANLCPDCQCRKSSLTYVYDDGKNGIEFCYEVCPACSRVSELIPIYDIDKLVVSDEDRALFITALAKPEYRLVMMVLDIFME